MTDKQINLAMGAITHAELVMDFPDVILDALNSVIAFLATMDEQPERKKGEWIVYTDCEGKGRRITCDQCSHEEWNWRNLNFCPNCGADMREGE